MTRTLKTVPDAGQVLDPVQSFKSSNTPGTKRALGMKKSNLAKRASHGNDPRKSQKANKHARRRAKKKAERLAQIPSFGPKPGFPWRDYSKLVYFTGGGVPNEKIPYPDKNESVQFAVTENLEVIDSLEGARMDGVFTLVPRKSTKGWIKKEYVEALNHIQKKGRNNRRNGVEKKSVSESGHIYNCYGMHAHRTVEWETTTVYARMGTQVPSEFSQNPTPARLNTFCPSL